MLCALLAFSELVAVVDDELFSDELFSDELFILVTNYLVTSQIYLYWR